MIRILIILLLQGGIFANSPHRIELVHSSEPYWEVMDGPEEVARVQLLFKRSILKESPWPDFEPKREILLSEASYALLKAIHYLIARYDFKIPGKEHLQNALETSQDSMDFLWRYSVLPKHAKSWGLPKLKRIVAIATIVSAIHFVLGKRINSIPFQDEKPFFRDVYKENFARQSVFEALELGLIRLPNHRLLLGRKDCKREEFIYLLNGLIQVVQDHMRPKETIREETRLLLKGY